MKKILLLAAMAIGFVSTATHESIGQDVLKVGDKAPNFTVTTFGDEAVKLSDRMGSQGHPVILLFSRANW